MIREKSHTMSEISIGWLKMIKKIFASALLCAFVFSCASTPEKKEEAAPGKYRAAGSAPHAVIARERADVFERAQVPRHPAGCGDGGGAQPRANLCAGQVRVVIPRAGRGDARVEEGVRVARSARDAVGARHGFRFFGSGVGVGVGVGFAAGAGRVTGAGAGGCGRVTGTGAGGCGRGGGGWGRAAAAAAAAACCWRFCSSCRACAISACLRAFISAALRC